MDLFFIPATTAFLVYIWNHTDFVVEWATLLRFPITYNWGYLRDFKKWNKAYPDSSYKEFLYFKLNKEQGERGHFLASGLECPVCLSTWITGILSVLTWQLSMWFTFAFLAIVLYYSICLLQKHA